MCPGKDTSTPITDGRGTTAFAEILNSQKNGNIPKCISVI